MGKKSLMLALFGMVFGCSTSTLGDPPGSWGGLVQQSGGDTATVLIGYYEGQDGMPREPAQVSPEELKLVGTGTAIGNRHVLMTLQIYFSLSNRAANASFWAVASNGRVWRIRFSVTQRAGENEGISLQNGDLVVALLSEDATLDTNVSFASPPRGQLLCDYTLTWFGTRSDGIVTQQQQDACISISSESANPTEARMGVVSVDESLSNAGAGGTVRDPDGNVVGVLVVPSGTESTPRLNYPFTLVGPQIDWLNKVRSRCLSGGANTCSALVYDEDLADEDKPINICQQSQQMQASGQDDSSMLWAYRDGKCIPRCVTQALNDREEGNLPFAEIYCVRGDEIPYAEERGLLVDGELQSRSDNWRNLTLEEGPSHNCNYCVVRQEAQTCADLVERLLRVDASSNNYWIKFDVNFDLDTVLDVPYEDDTLLVEKIWGSLRWVDLEQVFAEQASDAEYCWALATGR